MTFSALDGQRIAVWGVGRETRSFARHVADKLPDARITMLVLDEAAEVDGEFGAARVVLAAEAIVALADCDVLVRSPGVSIHRPEIVALRAQGLPVATPTGLWLAERKGRRVVGVTATKGKSTTATIAFHVASAAGTTAHLAGNIGAPALDLLDHDQEDLAIVELSSYQIADLACGPEVALVGNLYKEHVQWHGTEAVYRAEKLRLLTLPGVRRCVVNAKVRELLAAPRAGELRTFGTPEGWHVLERGVRRGEGPVVPTDGFPLPGPHNRLNLCAALTAVEAADAPLPEDLPGVLRGVEPLRHRLEPVHEHAGVLWVDDSISTTPESAIAAIASYPNRPVLLIGGGLDRGQEHHQLGRVLASRGATVIGMPDTGGRLLQAARAAGVQADRALTAADLSQAVALAASAAAPGAVVLLSPAAPSFHAYINYEARGDHFAALVRGGG